MNLELDASFQEEVVEHSTLVEVGAAALVGDGARSVAGAPLFVVHLFISYITFLGHCEVR